MADEFEDFTGEGQFEDQETPEEQKDDQKTPANKAFAAMRVENKEMKQQLQALANQNQQMQQMLAAMSQAAGGGSEKTSRARQYREQLHTRTVQSLEQDYGPAFQNLSEAQQQAEYWRTYNILAANDAAAFHVQQATKTHLAGSTVNTVLQEQPFQMLEAADREAIKKEVDQLPEGTNITPELVRTRAAAYIGLNFSRLAGRAQDDGKGDEDATKKKPRVAREGRTRAGDEGTQTPGPVPGAELFGGTAAGMAAGAAAASDLTGGSPGAGLQGPDTRNTGKKKLPKLEEEDFANMRRMGLDPASPSDVEDYVAARQKSKGKLLEV